MKNNLSKRQRRELNNSKIPQKNTPPKAGSFRGRSTQAITGYTSSGIHFIDASEEGYSYSIPGTPSVNSLPPIFKFGGTVMYTLKKDSIINRIIAVKPVTFFYHGYYNVSKTFSAPILNGISVKEQIEILEIDKATEEDLEQLTDKEKYIIALTNLKDLKEEVEGLLSFYTKKKVEVSELEEKLKDSVARVEFLENLLGMQ